MVAQSPEPGAHVLNARAFRIELEFRNVGFCGEGKTGVPGEKPLGAEKRTNNKLNPHMTSSPGIEPGPHWWKASVITTAPSLLPKSPILQEVSRVSSLILRAKPWLAQKVLCHGNRHGRYFSEGEKRRPEMRMLFAGWQISCKLIELYWKHRDTAL